MGWSIYLTLDGVQGGFSKSADFIVVPILLLAPPIALWIFGLAAGWALRGFEPDA
jgi:hypothetical protein